MADAEVESIIESGVAAVVVAAVLRVIRARIDARRAEADRQGADFEMLAAGRMTPMKPTGLQPETYESFERVRLGFDKIPVALSLTELRLPVIGPMLQRVRHALHGLVLYYVNMLAGKQMRFNEAVARTLGGVIAAFEHKPSTHELESLSCEVAALQKRVAELESRLQDGQISCKVCD